MDLQPAEKNSSETAPLSFKEKVGYGLGDMASNFYMGFFGLFLLYYYTDIFGLMPAAVGTMMLVTKIIDAITDPAMGLIADRTNTKWGRYRPYLLWVAIPYGLLGYMLFLGPNFSYIGKLIYAYITYSAIMLAYTAINVPYSALLAVISPVAKERTKATQYRFILASVGSMTVAAFTTPLTKLLGGDNELLGFRLTIIIFAILSVVLFWITFATTRERIKLKPHTSSVRQDFSEIIKNKSWLALVAGGILIVIGLLSRQSSIMYYLKYYMLDDGSKIFWIFDRTSVFTSSGFIGQLVGALITPYLVSRFNKHHLVFAVNILNIALLLVSYVIPPGYYGFIVTVHALGFMTFGITITLLFSMYTDCAEFGEWQTGKRTSGLIVAASMFSLKIGIAFGAAIPGYVLAAFGYVADQVQTAKAITGIRLMFNIIPAIFFLLGAIAMLFYKIDRAKLAKIEAELSERRHSGANQEADM